MDRPPTLAARIGALVAWVLQLKPVRVWTSYSDRRGPILAAGLGYHALFASFAALWGAFSVAGVVVSGNLDLREAIVQLLQDAVPGLIKDGSGSGAIDPDVLMSAGVYGVSGLVALVGLIFTALSWPAAAGDAVRAVYGVPPAPTNAILLKLRDLAFGLALGILLGIAAALAVGATSASGFLISWFGIDWGLAIWLSRAATLALVVLLEAVTVFAVYRVLGAVKLPKRLILQGVIIATIGLAALTMGGSILLGTTGRNPLIASFAVVAGLLIFFNVAGNIILIGASWIAVTAEDRGIDLTSLPGGAPAEADPDPEEAAGADPTGADPAREQAMSRAATDTGPAAAVTPRR